MLHNYPIIFIECTAMYQILSTNQFLENFEMSQSLPFNDSNILHISFSDICNFMIFWQHVFCLTGHFWCWHNHTLGFIY